MKKKKMGTINNKSRRISHKLLTIQLLTDIFKIKFCEFYKLNTQYLLNIKKLTYHKLFIVSINNYIFRLTNIFFIYI